MRPVCGRKAIRCELTAPLRRSERWCNGRIPLLARLRARLRQARKSTALLTARPTGLRAVIEIAAIKVAVFSDKSNRWFLSPKKRPEDRFDFMGDIIVRYYEARAEGSKASLVELARKCSEAVRKRHTRSVEPLKNAALFCTPTDGVDEESFERVNEAAELHGIACATPRVATVDGPTWAEAANET
jgi:hypothetical protein